MIPFDLLAAKLVVAKNLQTVLDARMLVEALPSDNKNKNSEIHVDSLSAHFL